MDVTDARDPEAVVGSQRAIQEEVGAERAAPAARRSPARRSWARGATRAALPRAASGEAGKESEARSAPMYDAPFWKRLGQARGQGRADHRRQFGDRPGGRGAVRPRGRRRRHRVSRRGRGRRGDQGRRRSARAAGRWCCAATSPTATICREAVARARRGIGRLDVLVNNAAFQVHTDDFLDLDAEHFDETLKTNLYGYFHMAQAAVPQMQPGSAIINTGSVTGIDGIEGAGRLFDDQGRHPRLHPRAGRQPARRAASG